MKKISFSAGGTAIAVLCAADAKASFNLKRDKNVYPVEVIHKGQRALLKLILKNEELLLELTPQGEFTVLSGIAPISRWFDGKTTLPAYVNEEEIVTIDNYLPNYYSLGIYAPNQILERRVIQDYIHINFEEVKSNEGKEVENDFPF